MNSIRDQHSCAGHYATRHHQSKPDSDPNFISHHDVSCCSSVGATKPLEKEKKSTLKSFIRDLSRFPPPCNPAHNEIPTSIRRKKVETEGGCLSRANKVHALHVTYLFATLLCIIYFGRWGQQPLVKEPLHFNKPPHSDMTNTFTRCPGSHSNEGCLGGCCNSSLDCSSVQWLNGSVVRPVAHECAIQNPGFQFHDAFFAESLFQACCFDISHVVLKR